MNSYIIISLVGGEGPVQSQTQRASVTDSQSERSHSRAIDHISADFHSPRYIRLRLSLRMRLRLRLRLVRLRMPETKMKVETRYTACATRPWLLARTTRARRGSSSRSHGHAPLCRMSTCGQNVLAGPTPCPRISPISRSCGCRSEPRVHASSVRRHRPCCTAGCARGGSLGRRSPRRAACWSPSLYVRARSG